MCMSNFRNSSVKGRNLAGMINRLDFYAQPSFPMPYPCIVKVRLVVAAEPVIGHLELLGSVHVQSCRRDREGVCPDCGEYRPILYLNNLQPPLPFPFASLQIFLGNSPNIYLQWVFYPSIAMTMHKVRETVLAH